LRIVGKIPTADVTILTLPDKIKLLMNSAIVKDIFSLKGRILLPKIISLVVGIISILVALKPPGMVLTLTGFSWALIASTTTVPLIFGLYSKREKTKTIIISMVAGFVVAFVWLVLRNPFGVHGFIPGLLASLLGYIAFK
jgi:SSS family solute:Na+ symporter